MMTPTTWAIAIAALLILMLVVALQEGLIGL